MIRKRSKFKKLGSFMFLILSFIGPFLSSDGTLFHDNLIYDMLCVPAPVFLLTLIFKRAYIFFEELHHCKTRYAGSMQLILKLCFMDSCFTRYFIIFVVYEFLMFIMWLKQSLPPKSDMWQYLNCIFFTALLFASWETFRSHYFGESNIHMNVKLKSVPSTGSVWANGACRSYFKPVVKDIRERIYEFEKQHNVLISLKKLMIIIPLSCDVRGTIDKYHPNIEYVDTLPPIITDQGANVNRRYLNPVYKIKFIADKPLYVAMEQPSPLLTLWKMRKTIPPDILKYQASIFIKVLEEELEGSDCKILIYDDGAKESLCDFVKRNINLILEEDRDKCSFNII